MSLMTVDVIEEASSIAGKVSQFTVISVILLIAKRTKRQISRWRLLRISSISLNEAPPVGRSGGEELVEWLNQEISAGAVNQHVTP